MGRRFDPSPNQAMLIALVFWLVMVVLIWALEG